MSVSQEALIDLVRREVLSKQDGKQQVVDPRSLAVAGDQFTLDFRLFSLAPPFWQDLRVHGQASFVDGQLAFAADRAETLEGSRGAKAVDALAAASGVDLVGQLSQEAQGVIPLPQSRELGGATLKLSFAGLEGTDGALRVTGGAEITPGAKKAAPKKKKEERRGGKKRDRRR